MPEEEVTVGGVDMGGATPTIDPVPGPTPVEMGGPTKKCGMFLIGW